MKLRFMDVVFSKQTQFRPRCTPICSPMYCWLPIRPHRDPPPLLSCVHRTLLISNCWCSTNDFHYDLDNSSAASYFLAHSVHSLTPKCLRFSLKITENTDSTTSEFLNSLKQIVGMLLNVLFLSRQQTAVPLYA